MIDDKKIEAAANKHIETEYARYNSGEVEEEMICLRCYFFFSSRRRHTRFSRDWSSDVCSSDLSADILS